MGEIKAQETLMKAIENVCSTGVLTADLGGTANTKEVTNAICDELEVLATKTKSLA